MKDIIANLLKIKSLMTLAVMAVFTLLSLNGSLEPAVTASVISSVITYYFTKESGNSAPVETTSVQIKTQDPAVTRETETGERH